jgi:predicted HTH domain antitoxin
MDNVYQLDIPRDILDAARLNLLQLKVEIAVHLYSQGRLSIGKARELANMSLWEFRQLLASRHIAPHYDVTDLKEDLETLRSLGRR